MAPLRHSSRSLVCVTFSYSFLSPIFSHIRIYNVFLGTTMMLGCIGVTLGITIGGLVPSIQMAQTFLPLILMPLILFSGFLVRPENIPIYFKWLYWGSFFQYG